MTGGNIASLNIQVTSNIAGAQNQLNALQRTLTQIRSGGSIFPNLSQTLTQLQGINRSVNTLGTSAGGITQQFINISSSGGLITNMLLGWVALGPRIMAIFKGVQDVIGFSRYIRNIPTMPNVGRQLINPNNISGGAKDYAIVNNLLWNVRNGATSAGAAFLYLGDAITNSGSRMASLRTAGQGFTETFRHIQDLFSSGTSQISWVSGMTSALKTLANIAMTITAVALLYLTKQFADLLAMGIKYNTTMEQYRITIGVLVGDESKAVELMKQMRDYADFSSLTSPQVIDAGQLLMNYGVKATGVMHVIRMLGDTSAGNVEKFKSQALAFGQIFSRGRVTGDNLKQLTEAGFNPMKELIKITGKTSSKLQDDMEAGKISVTDLVKAFEMATSEGGRFYNMQEKQSKSGIGIWSTIQDRASRLVGEGTTKLFEGLKPILQIVSDLLGSFLGNIDKIGQSISQNLVPPIEDAVKQFMQLAGLIDDGTTGMDNLSTVTDNWTSAMGTGIKVGMVIVNVVALIVGSFTAGVGLMIAGVSTIWNTFKVVFTTIYNFVQLIVGAIAGSFEWLWKQGYNLAVTWLFNPLVTAWNKIPFLKEDKKMTAATTYDNTGFLDTTGGQWIIDAANNYGKDVLDAGNSWLKTMETADAIFKTGGNLVNNSWENLFGDTSGVDRFLAKIRGEAKKGLGADLGGDLGIQDFTKDSKEAAAEAKKLMDEITNLIEKLVNMGNVFEKLTYEKFSPSKLMYRMTRFFKEIAQWASNINQLSIAGMPQDMVNELRGMGIQGYGIAKGLAQTPEAQRKEIYDMYRSSKDIAINQAVQKVAYEHSGVVLVKGVSTEGELIATAKLIAKDIYNQAPTYVDPAKQSIYNITK